MTESAGQEGEERQQRLDPPAEHPTTTFTYGTQIPSGKTEDEAPARRDAAFYEEVRQAVGRGTPTLLLGTSTRSLERNLKKLKAVQQDRLPFSTAVASKTSSETATDVFTERDHPVSEQEYSRLKPQADAALTNFLQDNPVVAEEFKETTRARIHLQELDGRMREAENAAQQAEQRRAVLATRLDPTDYRVFGFAIGAALVSLLVALDVIPLYWVAQAFRLDSAATWLMALILVVASVGAMVGFEVTRENARRRRLLVVVIVTAYLALSAARAEFLTTVADESYPVAILQATLLNAVSAGLVVCGSVVLARTQSLSLSRTRTAARRAGRAAAVAATARTRSADKLQRHINGLGQMLLSWVLGSDPPLGIDRAKWTAVLERAIRDFFRVHEWL